MNTWAGIKFVRIPKGLFIIGSKDNNKLAWDDEKPQHNFELSYDYWAGKFPISVSDFREFVKATSYVTRAETEGWCWVWNVDEMKWEKSEGVNWKHPSGNKRHNESMEHYPVGQVCWYDAKAYSNG